MKRIKGYNIDKHKLSNIGLNCVIVMSSRDSEYEGTGFDPWQLHMLASYQGVSYVLPVAANGNGTDPLMGLT